MSYPQHMSYVPSTPTPFNLQSPHHRALVEMVKQYREARWFEDAAGSDEEVAELAVGDGGPKWRKR